MTFTVAGTRILITGAAMGMGRLYAERAVAEGAETIILWDINKEALSDTTKALRVHADNTQEIVPMLVDIGQRGDVATMRKLVNIATSLRDGFTMAAKSLAADYRLKSA